MTQANDYTYHLSSAYHVPGVCKVSASDSLGPISPRPLALFPAPRLRELRLARLLSIDALAKATKVSRTSIMQLEHGGLARAATIRNLATYLEVTPDELMAQRQPPEAS